MGGRRQPTLYRHRFLLPSRHVGFARGHGAGAAPRNRTKSSTTARSRPATLLSPAAELKRLAATPPVSASGDPGNGKSHGFRWEDDIDDPEPAEVFGALRWLADSLRQGDPLAALGVQAGAGAAELGRLLFDARSDVNEVAIAPFDPAACGVARDASAIWRRLIDLPAGEWPGHVADDALVLVAATGTGGGSEAPLAVDGLNIGWIGPEPPSWLGVGMTRVGRFILPSAHGRCSPLRLYAGLNLLIAKAWSHHAPKKAAVLQRHLTGAADAITAVLGDARLLAALREVAAANARWRIAFFISLFAGCGRVWEEQFDAAGRVMLVHHGPDQCAHGPIVTIDGGVDHEGQDLYD